MDIRSQLSERRKTLGLTLAEVAVKVGVSEATVSRWESGHIDNMKRDKIALLAKALEVSPLFIMGIADDEIKQDSPDTINEKIKKLSAEKQKEVEKIVDDISTGTIAAHRTDDPMDELPEEARKSIEEFKKFIFEKHGIKYN